MKKRKPQRKANEPDVRTGVLAWGIFTKTEALPVFVGGRAHMTRIARSASRRVTVEPIVILRGPWRRYWQAIP